MIPCDEIERVERVVSAPRGQQPVSLKPVSRVNLEAVEQIAQNDEVVVVVRSVKEFVELGEYVVTQVFAALWGSAADAVNAEVGIVDYDHVVVLSINSGDDAA